MENDFDKNKTLSVVGTRIKTLPRGMNNIFALSGQYLNNQFEISFFVENYIRMSQELISNIENRENKEKFEKNYNVEIIAIKSILQSCKSYKNKQMSENALKSDVLSILQNYALTPIGKRDYFMY